MAVIPLSLVDEQLPGYDVSTTLQSTSPTPFMINLYHLMTIYRFVDVLEAIILHYEHGEVAASASEAFIALIDMNSRLPEDDVILSLSIYSSK